MLWKDCKRDFTEAVLEVLPWILKTDEYRHPYISSKFSLLRLQFARYMLEDMCKKKIMMKLSYYYTATCSRITSIMEQQP